MKRDDVQAIDQEATRKSLRMGYSRAVRKVDKLIADPNDGLALQASQAMAARAEAAAMGTDAQSGVQSTRNHGIGAEPVLGMPDRQKDEGE